ncbi:MAG: hypothetical protein HY351_00605 [Candidatus Omnitrophica bacterium]|nr:hypothetical protein [Candidatus Omnitrophota bacterium]
MNTLIQPALTKHKRSKIGKAVALCTAIFFAWSLALSAPLYADGDRVEFNKEISGEKQSSNYDRLAGKGEGDEGANEPSNIASGKGSASGSVAEGSVEGSTSIPGGDASGSASGSVLSGKAEGEYSVDVTDSGVEVSGGGSVEGTLAEGTVTGQANTSAGPVKAQVEGTGAASVKAEAHGSGKASVSTSGATLEGEVGVSAAAKAEGRVSCTGSCFGVSVTGEVEGDLRAGASAEARGIVSIDGGKIIFGGKIAGALGVGGGAGASIKIDASELIDNVKGWFRSWFEPEGEPNPPPQTPSPAPNNVTTNFSAFDALHGVTPTAALDSSISSRDMNAGFSVDRGQQSSTLKSDECEPGT